MLLVSCMFSFFPVVLIWGQFSSPVQEWGLSVSHGDVCRGRPLQQQTGDIRETLLFISRQMKLIAVYGSSMLVAGGNGTAGLPVAPAGEEGSRGHEGAEGAQRVSAAQHTANSCGAALPGEGSKQ